jgi:hypothetical protein
MKTTININNLAGVSKSKFQRILSNLEKISKIAPTTEIREFSHNRSWPINKKDITIKGSQIRSKIDYRVEFYHVNQETGKEYPLGEIHYSSPIRI